MSMTCLAVTGHPRMQVSWEKRRLTSDSAVSSRQWHLAERRDGFFLNQTKKKHREKEKVGMGPEMCRRHLLPGQVKKETERGLTHQSPPSQKSTETRNRNTAQLSTASV